MARRNQNSVSFVGPDPHLGSGQQHHHPDRVGLPDRPAVFDPGDQDQQLWLHH